jgi:hypothetical protein
MPFCEDCAKYWAPSAMTEEGACPTCGRVLEEPKVASTTSSANAQAKYTAKNLDLHALAAGEDGDADDMRAPWHFKLLVVLLVAYLVWRVVQMVA